MGDDEKTTLYRVAVQTDTSPAELKAFTDILESHGYVVVTDLKKGKLEVRGDPDSMDRQPPKFNEMDDPVMAGELPTETPQ